MGRKRGEEENLETTLAIDYYPVDYACLKTNTRCMSEIMLDGKAMFKDREFLTKYIMSLKSILN